MIQLFFAGLGDANAIPLKDQLAIANRVRIEHSNVAKNKAKADQQRRKAERAEARRLRMGTDATINSDDEEESKVDDLDKTTTIDHESNDKESEGQNSELERKRQKKREQKEKEDKMAKINTNTEVMQDSKAKRAKIDDAVRKILLFKDMRATDNKGDQDPDMKLNQLFIRETINQYSGAITAPSNIVARKLVLPGYFLNEGVCKSLNTYFGALTYDQLQVLDLKENGLKDANFALLLSSLAEQRALK